MMKNIYMKSVCLLLIMTAPAYAILTAQELATFHDAVGKNRFFPVSVVLGKNSHAASIQDVRGDNALHIAMQRRSNQWVINKLLAQDLTILASVNKSGSTPLMSAVIWNNRRGVEHLLGYVMISHLNVRHRDRYGRSSLDYAAWLGYVDIAKMLLAAGAQEDVPSALSLVCRRHIPEHPMRQLLESEEEPMPALEDEAE